MNYKRVATFVAVSAVVATGLTNPDLASATSSPRHAVSQASVGSGLALVVDRSKATSLASGCHHVTAPSGLVLDEVTIIGGSHAAKISIAGTALTIPARARRGFSDWIHVERGGYSVCLAAGVKVVVARLAHTATPSAAMPGGRVNVSARIPLATRGTRSGSYKLTAPQSPAGSAGLMLQLQSARSGVIRIGSAGRAVDVTVGPTQSASSIVVPASRTVTWRRVSGSGAPTALLLGFITQQTSRTLGGARVHLMSKTWAQHASAWHVSGSHGLPTAGSAMPATAVFARLDRASASVSDPLAQQQRTPLGVVAGKSTGTALRISTAGAVSFTGAAWGAVVAWLAGDVVRSAKAIDLSHSTTRPISRPGKSQLAFAGSHPFKVGSVLLLGNTKLTPGGLIAVVDAVSHPSGTTVITFHKGGLLDAYAELDLTTSVPLTKPGKAKSSHDVTPINGSIGLDFSKSATVALGKNPSLTGSVGFDIHPSVSLSVTVHTGAFDIPTGVSIHYALDATTSVSETLSVGGSWSGSTSIPLGKLVLGGFDLGPLFVVPELSASIDLSASFSAQATLERSISEHAHVGMTTTLDSHGLNTYKDSSNGFDRPVVDSSSAPSFQANASASAKVNLSFDLAIEGVAGPDATATAGVTLSVNPGASPWWQVQASADLSVGFNLDVLDIPILKTLLGILNVNTHPTWSLWHLGPWTIASANGALPPPAGGGSGTGPGTGGGSGGGGSTPVGGSSVGPIPAGAYAETTGGPSKTWSNYANGGDRQGPTIAGNQTVGIACKITGLRLSNGNSWWYQVASSPWSGDYYVSADAFYNNGQTSGSLQGTPFVDSAVPDCRDGGSQTGGDGGAVSGTPETTGGTANTWTNYSNAGGSEGPGIAGQQTVVIACRVDGFRVSDGNTAWYQIASSPWSNNFYVSADAFYNNGSTSGSLHGTPFFDPAVPVCGSGGGGGSTQGTVTETVGGVTHTWTDYNSAGGTQGPSVASYQSIQITCRTTGFTVADGNTWWYQIESSPWSNTFWASADAFYNNGSTSGSLHGTPFFDPAVPVCGSSGGGTTPPSTWGETVGGVTHTWTDYNSAGGTQGQSIQTSQTVQITCRLNGFRVADGNTWWYRIASSPWNNSYYASADAFYNNGQTTGSLHGTPFYDPAVPTC